MKALVRVVIWPLRVYQRTLSRWTPPMCRFTPTCSQYAIESFETHGLWHGATRTTWRLLRCQPLCRGGFDPVAGGPSDAHRAKHAGCPAPDPCERCR